MPIYEAEDLDPLPEQEPDTEVWREYRAGMRSLAYCLIVLSVLQLGVSGLLMLRGDFVIFAVVAAMAAFDLISGVLLLLGQHWVNHLVAVWGVLVATGNCCVLPSLRGGAPAVNGIPSMWIALAIAGALVYLAVKNVKLYKRATAPYGSRY